jgi:hypothetical protein
VERLGVLGIGEVASVALRIIRGTAVRYLIKKPPEPRVCKECDFRIYCEHEGTFKLEEHSP